MPSSKIRESSDPARPCQMAIRVRSNEQGMCASKIQAWSLCVSEENPARLGPRPSAARVPRPAAQEARSARLRRPWSATSGHASQPTPSTSLLTASWRHDSECGNAQSAASALYDAADLRQTQKWLSRSPPCRRHS